MPASALVQAVSKKSAWLFSARSARLAISLRLGMRQAPAAEPSARPHCPLARARAAATASLQVPLTQSARLSQTRPVTVSVSVPSPLSRMRCEGSATPAWTLPSSPAA